MASSLDLDQVLYARAGWRKAILIPLWAFQVTVLLGLMGVFAYRLAETFEHYEEHDKLGEMPIVEVVYVASSCPRCSTERVLTQILTLYSWEATNVGFNLIALLLNILEIARKATERLTPFMMVCTHVIKLTLAFAVLALDIVAYLQRIDGHYSTIGLSLDCGLLYLPLLPLPHLYHPPSTIPQITNPPPSSSAATLTTFIYSIITYRRLLKYDDYDLTANPQARGGGDGLELGHHTTTRGFSDSHQTTGITTTRTTELHYSDYPSQTQHLGLGAFPAASTTAASTTSTATFATAHATPTPSPSGSVLKREVDRAIGAEFGWGSPVVPPPLSTPTQGQGQGGSVVNRAGSVVVGGGRVGVPVVVGGGPAAGELQRQHSWVTERGVVTADGGEEDDGVVMGGVGLGVSGQGGRGEEDEHALLPRK